MASPLAKQVAACNKRAREKGVEGTLSVFEWQRSLDYFAGVCAYCQKSLALTIDHFVPIAFGGGTTYSNCVPCCYFCNTRKGSAYPEGEAVSFIAPEQLEHVRSYLVEIGNRHQESFKKLYERLPLLAQFEIAVVALKQYCQENALRLDDPCAMYYGLLRLSIFGVDWDPAPYFQVCVSLSWQKEHARDPLLKIVCEDATSFLVVTKNRLKEAVVQSKSNE